MNKITTSLLFASVAAMLVACSGRPVKIASVTDSSRIDRTRGRTISAEAGGFQLLGFIPININSRQQRAYQELLRVADGDEIADVKLSETWAYGFVGTTYWTVFQAKAYPRKPVLPRP